MKTVKATWMAARPKCKRASIGSTNCVQPYCMLATAAMQITPSSSWIHGLLELFVINAPDANFAGSGDGVQWTAAVLPAPAIR
jgi:hypothetical protein